MKLDTRGVTLITGRPGVGKTILAMRFVDERVKMGERVFWISLSENRETLFKNASLLGYDLSKIFFWDLIFIKPDVMANQIVSMVSQEKYDLVVIDSISPILESLQSRDYLVNAIYRTFRSADVDLIVTAEEEMSTPFDYIADNVFHLKLIVEELTTERRLYVSKFRGHRAGYYVEFDIIEGRGIVFLDEIPRPTPRDKWEMWSDTISHAIGEIRSGRIYLFQGKRLTHILARIAADIAKQGYRVLYRTFSRSEAEVSWLIEKYGGIAIVQRVKPEPHSHFRHMKNLYDSLRDFDIDVLISDGIDIEFLLYGEKALYMNMNELNELRDLGITAFMAGERSWGLDPVADVVAHFKRDRVVVHSHLGVKVCEIEGEVICDL